MSWDYGLKFTWVEVFDDESEEVVSYCGPVECSDTGVDYEALKS